jgi:hypothetical protein
MLDASFCVEALNEVIVKYGNPEVMNADQERQFTGAAWTRTLTGAGVEISMPPGVYMQTPAGIRWTGPLSRQYLH